MLKVFALPGDLAVTRSYSLGRFLAPMATLFLSRKGLLCLRELFLCPAEVARVVDELPGGECRKVGHSQVNTDVLVAQGLWFRLADFARKYGVPVFAFSFDS